ncbi:MAG: hypothetical protein R2765_04855 [Ferruginibacter sp.]|nr:hypothetical protein [Bacteroidota bacterium]MBX2920119.1 hypothetical protein [Ferruginibacter sp.]MCB0708269.1 hypothetical protein [Chitinophagaceae bacterium]MCC7377971.1 hypothetical protein [Chitinophagaceae bacterium]
MKRLSKIFSVILPLVLLLQTSLFAQNNDEFNNKKKYEFVKNKSVNKTYNVSSSDKLNIQNSFGNVDIKTWSKNEIKVDIEIEVSANSDALAQKILDKITITDTKSTNEISFKTKVSDVNNSKGDKSSMSINYTVFMPAVNPLTVKNEFGATNIPDLTGAVDLTSKFGSLTTGNLANIKNIHVEFGKANLANINNAPVNIKFSKAVISKLSGAVKMNLEFCNNVRLNIDNNLSSLDLKTSYSTVNLKPNGALPALYTISTSFGSFKNTSDIKFSSDDDNDNDSPRFNHQYNGKNGNGTIPVKVKSSFSKIIIGEASENDMKDKNKSEDRTS